MIVDDEESALTACAGSQYICYDVSEPNRRSGAGAVATVARPAAVDVNLPGQYGLDFLRQLQTR